MKKIPLMAHKCPYCREEGKEVNGRLILVILLILVLWFVASHSKKDNVVLPDKNNQVEVYKKIEKDKRLLKNLKEIGIE